MKKSTTFISIILLTTALSSCSIGNISLNTGSGAGLQIGSDSGSIQLSMQGDGVQLAAKTASGELSLSTGNSGGIGIKGTNNESISISGNGIAINSSGGNISVTGTGIEAGNIKLTQSGASIGNTTISTDGIQSENFNISQSGITVGGVTLNQQGLSTQSNQDEEMIDDSLTHFTGEKNEKCIDSHNSYYNTVLKYRNESTETVITYKDIIINKNTGNCVIGYSANSYPHTYYIIEDIKKGTELAKFECVADYDVKNDIITPCTEARLTETEKEYDSYMRDIGLTRE